MVAGRELGEWVGGGRKTLSESGESGQSGGGGGDGIPELRARGPMDLIEGGKAVIACPPCRAFADIAVGKDRVVSTCLALESVSVWRVVAQRAQSWFGVWKGLCEWCA
jgi:hypothetical protein